MVRAIILALADVGEGRMGLRAPVDTSFLRDQIEPHFPSMNEVVVFSGAEYAIWVELLWGKRNFGGFHIPSSKGYVADTREDVLEKAEDVMSQEIVRFLK